jgi:hypothetical protein
MKYEKPKLISLNCFEDSAIGAPQDCISNGSGATETTCVSGPTDKPEVCWSNGLGAQGDCGTGSSATQACAANGNSAAQCNSTGAGA